MNSLNIAARNVWRNPRRSLMTTLAIVIGTLAILLFGGYVAAIFAGMQTNIVRAAGHLHVHKNGFFDFGAGNPTAYDIADYESVVQAIADDTVLRKYLAVVTPTLQLVGIASQYDKNTSTTFVGQGVIPADQQRLRQWDGFALGLPVEPYPLTGTPSGAGVIGVGLARILELCGSLPISGCRQRPSTSVDNTTVDAKFAADIQQLVESPATTTTGGATLDLLSATTNGAPNVVSLTIAKTEQQGMKELDDRYVAMHLQQAQKLLYGRAPGRANTLILQLTETTALATVVDRLQQLFKEKQLDLEIKTFDEFVPLYKRVNGLFFGIFAFIALVIGLVVLFTVINTMTMCVMERFNEIGTLRALGLRRSGIRTYFVLEGSIIGIVGATAGLLLALLAAYAINHAGLSWQPPSSSTAQPLQVRLANTPALIVGCWLILVAIASVSSMLPANKAAKMTVVDALRHV